MLHVACQCMFHLMWFVGATDSLELLLKREQIAIQADRGDSHSVLLGKKGECEVVQLIQVCFDHTVVLFCGEKSDHNENKYVM